MTSDFNLDEVVEFSKSVNNWKLLTNKDFILFDQPHNYFFDTGMPRSHSYQTGYTGTDENDKNVRVCLSNPKYPCVEIAVFNDLELLFSYSKGRLTQMSSDLSDEDRKIHDLALRVEDKVVNEEYNKRRSRELLASFGEKVKRLRGETQ